MMSGAPPSQLKANDLKARIDMDAQEKQSVIKRYSDRLQEKGYCPEALGWGKHRHQLRYHILLSQWPLDGATVLDFGCGFGDMGAFAAEQGIAIDYSGVDINADLVATGKQAHPGFKLSARDFLADQAGETYDYIFSSGVHNLKLKDSPGFIKETFAVFSRCARKGFAINFISDKVDYQDEHLHYSDPGEILNLALGCSHRVVLRHDYMPYEFTVFVSKENEAVPGLHVYPEYRHFIK